MDKIHHDEQEVTKFNAALSSLERLHTLLLEANTYSREATLQGYNAEALRLWRYTCFTIFRELMPKLKPEERKYINKLFKASSDFPPLILSQKTEHGSALVMNRASFDKHFQAIHKIESQLRILADKRGMLIPNKEPVLGSIGEME